MRSFAGPRLLSLLGCALALAISIPARAQPPISQFGLGGGGFGSSRDAEANLNVQASFTTAASQPAELTITAEIPAGWHIYSLTQGPGGPNPTRIKLDSSPEYRLSGAFVPDPPPKVHMDADFPGVPLEEQSGRVTWRAPIELAAGVDPSKLEIKGRVNAQRCKQSCLPPTDFSFTARLAGTAVQSGNHEQRVTAAPPRPAVAPVGRPMIRATSDSHLSLSGWLEPAVAAPGTIATLTLSAEPSDSYHVYALASRDPIDVGKGKPTLIVLTDTAGWQYTLPQASAEPIEAPVGDGVEGNDHYYNGPVRWTANLKIPESTRPGEYTIAGLIGYQTCGKDCEIPQGAQFSGTIKVGAAAEGHSSALLFVPTAYSDVAKEADARGPAAKPGSAATAAASPASPASSKSLPVVILFSLLGGLILNLMPCVLPVIGLKVLSFVEQGGKSRSHVFALNLWYSLGLMLVFMVLAALAVNLGLAWGEHFQSTAFNVVLSAIVFVMALSFLGVWEIPIPGFVGSGKAAEVASREGAIGAFAKGVLTTVLATPCSGPFLGSVFGYTLKQPPQIVYLVFGCIGLGMASPYLLIGAVPSLIRFLPKPGAWMDTFKQMMGFLLLGTVVYLFTFLNRNYLVPTFALLIGLWAGCWWIGRTPLTAELGRKLRAWIAGGAFAALIGVFAFVYLVPGPSVLDWQPFSRTRLDQLTGEGNTVLVDFTANWCPTCKLNLRIAIDTEDVRDVVKTNHVVPLVADFTDYSPEIKEMLKSLGSDSIPVLAIFPADHPDQPIILRDLVTQGQVIKALKEAGPSQRRPAAVGDARPAGGPGGITAVQ